ncbi:unnamed protein product [Trichobilharzia regenti]|nr:unnamed protein product [Trichobilharzia regenti]
MFLHLLQNRRHSCFTYQQNVNEFFSCLLKEKKRKEAEEASKKQRKPGQKRKGLGGLSKEKKRLLKQLIMQKAADEMKAEMKRRQEERETFLRGKVEPLKLDGLGESKGLNNFILLFLFGNRRIRGFCHKLHEINTSCCDYNPKFCVNNVAVHLFHLNFFSLGDLTAKVKQLYERIRQLEGDKYDWEEKLRRQDFEVILLYNIFFTCDTFLRVDIRMKLVHCGRV